jgi:glucose 1-dehydrogenase
MRRFQGKVALVTGASRGIGRGIAEVLAEEGADVVFNYRSHTDEARQVAEAITRTGQKVAVFQADIADRTAVERMVAATVEQFGHIDMAISNTGLQYCSPLVDADWVKSMRSFEVSQLGVFHICQLCARQMIRQVEGGRPGGKIVIISSVHQEIPFRDFASYNMSKAAIGALGRTMAAELAAYRINVNVINPGWIDTPGERDTFGSEQIDTGGKFVPWGRLGKPREIGKVAAFLVSDDADYITGSTLTVDGGFTLKAAINLDNLGV